MGPPTRGPRFRDRRGGHFERPERRRRSRGCRADWPRKPTARLRSRDARVNRSRRWPRPGGFSLGRPAIVRSCSWRSRPRARPEKLITPDPGECQRRERRVRGRAEESLKATGIPTVFNQELLGVFQHPRCRDLPRSPVTAPTGHPGGFDPAVQCSNCHTSQATGITNMVWIAPLSVGVDLELRNKTAQELVDQIQNWEADQLAIDPDVRPPRPLRGRSADSMGDYEWYRTPRPRHARDGAGGVLAIPRAHPGLGCGGTPGDHRSGGRGRRARQPGGRWRGGNGGFDPARHRRRARSGPWTHGSGRGVVGRVRRVPRISRVWLRLRALATLTRARIEVFLNPDDSVRLQIDPTETTHQLPGGERGLRVFMVIVTGAKLLCQFVRDHGIRSLNVAGSRESKEPGIYSWVMEILGEAFFFERLRPGCAGRSRGGVIWLFLVFCFLLSPLWGRETDSVVILKSLLDPVKLDSLQGDRAANSRLRLMMYWVEVLPAGRQGSGGVDSGGPAQGWLCWHSSCGCGS